MIESCKVCQEHLLSIAPEPLLMEAIPSQVFEDISVDPFSHQNNHYMICVDRFSGWPVVEEWIGRDLRSKDIIDELRKWFMMMGAPNRLRSDGGPQFTSSEIREFLDEWGVLHVFSSPHFPQSNGHAEAAVKAMKILLIKTAPKRIKDSDSFARGLLEWRNTPKADGLSQNQIIFGHNLRSHIPVYPSSFVKRRLTAETIDQARDGGRRRMKNMS